MAGFQGFLLHLVRSFRTIRCEFVISFVGYPPYGRTVVGNAPVMRRGPRGGVLARFRPRPRCALRSSVGWWELANRNEVKIMTSFRSSAIFCALLSVLMILFAAQTIGQTVTGTISGNVKDSSGLALAGAKVEVQNMDTGVNREIQADAAGHYAALLLPLGSYKVTGAQPGFQTEARSGIELTIGREAVVDLILNVGATSQTA